MLNFKKYFELLEEGNLSKPCIIIDVQPTYAKFCDKIVDPLCDFLNKRKGPVFLFYNGPDVGCDEEYQVVEYFQEHGLSEEKLQDCIFKEKTYAFFRNWMDAGMERSDLKKAIRYMVVNRVNDSRDVPIEDWQKLFGDNWENVADIVDSDSINIPDINFAELKRISGCYLMGGKDVECLSEFRFILETFNIKYTLVTAFIY